MNFKSLFVDKDKVLVVNMELAIMLDSLDEAIVLNQLNYWIERNKLADRNLHDGKYWIYNSYEAWKKQDFPFWSATKIKRIFTSLEKKGIVLSANYNRLAIDKTKWYTIDYDKLKEIIDDYSTGQNEPTIGQNERPSDQNGQSIGQNDQTLGQSDRPIPEITTDINTDITDNDYRTENTDINASQEGEPSFKEEKIYASSTSRESRDEKPNRYISPDYSYRQLREHIRPVYDKRLKTEHNFNDSDTPLEKILNITIEFHKMYELEIGKKHPVLSDIAYEKIVDRFLNPPDVMDDWDMFNFDCYMEMAKLYFKTEYNKLGNYKGTIKKSFSHFMSYTVRENLFYRTQL